MVVPTLTVDSNSWNPTPRPVSGILLIPLGVGLFIRLLLLLLSGWMQPVYDECRYIYDALVIDRFGIYGDIWPPGYPATIAIAVSIFGFEGLLYLKLFQVLCSTVTGFCIVQMSHMLFGLRGALVSGFTWALYLPLACFSHRYWPETIFLAVFITAMYLLLCYLRTAEPRRARLIPLLAGVLFGISLYFKEVATYLPIPLTLWLIIKDRRRLSRALIFPLGILVIILPWTLRNYEIYGRFVLVGNTLGANVRKGLNATYTNHDYNHDMQLMKRIHWNVQGEPDYIARKMLHYETGWEPSRKLNDIDRTRANVSSAVQHTLCHPGSFVLTRIKKLADFFTPLSFPVRDMAGKTYKGMLASTRIRRVLVGMSLAAVMIVLPLAWINLVRLRRDRTVAFFFLINIAYFTLTALLVSMSRFRVPMIPFALILIGGTVVRSPWTGNRLISVLLSMLGVIVLLALWTLNLPEIAEVVRQAWN